MRSTEIKRVDEDEDGYTIWSRAHDRVPVSAPMVATALGRLASTTIPSAPWLAEGHVRSRLAQSEEHDGWPTLGRTTIADAAESLWSRRETYLARLDEMPRVPVHGDLVRENLLAPYDAGVFAIDWAGFGWGAAGEDLGMWALSSESDPANLVETYCEEYQGVEAAEVLWAARVVMAFTVLSRTEWALTRVAKGEGPLAAKFRHPVVAPYIRALSHQLPTIEEILDA